MTQKDYDHVLNMGKIAEKQIIDCIAQVYKGDTTRLHRQLFIPVDAHILDSYIEVIYCNDVEVASLEVSGRSVCIMPIGYRG